jgi:ribosomal protein L7Ae-like RNA K-turn-binding protein
MKRNRGSLLQTLGLARRAGVLVFGTGAVRTAVREGKARVVLLAADAAAGQARKVKPLLEHRGIPHRVWGTREELGSAIGAAEVSAVAITAKSFAQQVLSRLDDHEGRQ